VRPPKNREESSLKNLAKLWYRKGFNPIPLKTSYNEEGEDKEIYPQISSWRKYQDERMSEETFKELFEGRNYDGFAIILGTREDRDYYYFAIDTDSRLRWKKLQRMKEKSRIVMEDKRPTKDQLKKILLHLPLRGEALVLCLASSGMRRGELLQVTEDHVHFEETPTRIELEPEWCKKSHRGRTVFISHEASEKLKKWIEFKKGRFEKHGINKEKQREIRESDRIFPFTCSWANQIWKRGLEKAGLSQKDDKTGYLELHLHTLRKFFRTKMEAEIPQQTVEFLLGHKGYLSDSYRRLTIQEAGEDYLEGEPAVTIHETKYTLEKELEEKLEERNHKIEELREELTETKEELEKLKKERRMDERMREIAREVIGEELPKIQSIIGDKGTETKKSEEELEEEFLESLEEEED